MCLWGGTVRPVRPPVRAGRTPSGRVRPDGSGARASRISSTAPLDAAYRPADGPANWPMSEEVCRIRPRAARGGECGARDGEVGQHVGVEDCARRVRVDLFHGAEQSIAGVVHQDVQAPCGAHGFGQDVLCVGCRGRYRAGRRPAGPSAMAGRREEDHAGCGTLWACPARRQEHTVRRFRYSPHHVGKRPSGRDGGGTQGQHPCPSRR